MESLSWGGEHWFDLFQSVGIMAGFALAWRSFLLDSRTRRVEIYLTLTEAHRQIWDKAVANPHLASVLDSNRNVSSQPPTNAEKRLVLLLLLHTASVHKAASLGLYPLWDGLLDDLRDFYRRPVPRSVFDKYAAFQEPRFQCFMKKLMDEQGHPSDNASNTALL